MGDVQLGTLAVKLKADTVKWESDIDRAKASLDGIADKARRVVAASGAAFAGLSGIGLVGLKIAADFEAGMARVKAVAQITDKQVFARLKESALEFAGATQYTAREVSEGMGFMAMAGFDAVDTISTMPSVLQLAAAGMIDLGTAADITTNILTGMGMGAEELADANDVLVSAMTGANVNTRMLGEAFKYVGPVAKSAGVPFKEVTAAIAMLGNAGIQGSMAGTTLRQAIAGLLKPTSAAAATIDSLGMKVMDSTGKIRPLVDIIGDLERAGATLPEIVSIFGMEAGPGMAALIGQGSDAIAKFTDRLDASGGVAKRIADENMATLSGRIMILKSGLERIAITIGDALMPAAKRLAGVLQQIIDYTNGLSDGTKNLIVYTATAVAGLLGLTAALAGLVAVLPFVIAQLAVVAPAILAVGIAAATAGALLVGYREVSKTTTSDIALMWRQLGEDIKDAVGDTIVDSLSGFLRSVASSFGDLADSVSAEFGFVFGALVDNISAEFGFLVDGVGKMWDWLAGTKTGQVVSRIASHFGGLVDDVSAEFSFLVDNIARLWDWLADTKIVQIGKSIASTFALLWKTVFAVFFAPFKAAVNAVSVALDYWGKKLGLVEDVEVPKSGEGEGGGEGGGLLGGWFDRMRAGAEQLARDQITRDKAAAAAARARRRAGAGAGADASKRGGSEDKIYLSADFKKRMRDQDVASGRFMAPAVQAAGAGDFGVGGLAPDMSGVFDSAAESFKEATSEESKKVAKSIGRAFSYAGDTLYDSLIGGSELLGGVLEGAAAGMEVGGPWGAVIGAIVALMTETEFFAGVISMVDEVLMRVVGVLDQLLGPITPLIDAFVSVVFGVVELLFAASGVVTAIDLLRYGMTIVSSVLGAVVRVIGPLAAIIGEVSNGTSRVLMSMLGFSEMIKLMDRAVGQVSRTIAVVVMAIGGAWNWIVDKLADFAKKLRLKGLAKSIRKAKIDIAAMRDASRHTPERDGGAFAETAEDVRDLGGSMRELSASLTNVPEVFKINAARFAAINADEGFGSAPDPMGSSAGSTTINVMIHGDVDEAAERIADALESRGHATKGSRMAGNAYSSPNTYRR